MFCYCVYYNVWIVLLNRISFSFEGDSEFCLSALRGTKKAYFSVFDCGGRKFHSCSGLLSLGRD